MRFRFITSTPLEVRAGSGTYVGITVLARALKAMGHSVAFETPPRRLPVFTAERLLFNRSLRAAADFDLTVGFDMDGYRIAGSPGHVAALKGVIADEVRFERGLTKLTMQAQARCERLHVRRAARVMVTSRYCAGQVRELYGLEEEPAIVPEPIELEAWKRLLAGRPAAPADRFTVLSVGRFYRRKRLDVLLRAAAGLRERIPELALRIVGNGPCAANLHRLAGELRLGSTVTWLGDISRSQLAQEYNGASVFCLPSVQEGFGIVLLEAMAAGKPIVAARAAAIPEVVPHAEFAEPDNAAALADAIERLWRSPEAGAAQVRAGSRWVKQFDAPQVAQAFVAACPVTCTAA
ncbi:MAG TPA: glycosyltransferase family 4 protein [Bryobacteraceae bacterium]|nr:glycosyltransferase family 4 protein [Bryobacteraceae bacterium]